MADKKSKPHKLKDLKITNVDFVDQGANRRADILITKRKDRTEGALRKAWEAISKALGFDTPEPAGTGRTEPADPAGEPEGADPVKKDARDFDTQIGTANLDAIFQEIWKFTDAIGASLRSILSDENIADEDRLSLMEQSIDQFSAAVRKAAAKWSAKQLSNIAKARGDGAPPAAGTGNPEGETKHMKIDKSKMTKEERETFEALMKKYSVNEEPEGASGAANPVKKDGASGAKAAGNDDPDDDPDGTAKCGGRPVHKSAEDEAKNSADPIVKSLMDEIADLKKYKENAEQRELEGIAKKYEPLGMKAEDLVPTLKNLKAMGGDAYGKYIATLDTSLSLQEQSGMFDEIGKSARGMSGAGAHGQSTAEAKIEGIAKSMCEKDPDLSYNIAKARAWAQNPDLYEQYEKETGI